MRRYPLCWITEKYRKGGWQLATLAVQRIKTESQSGPNVTQNRPLSGQAGDTSKLWAVIRAQTPSEGCAPFAFLSGSVRASCRQRMSRALHRQLQLVSPSQHVTRTPRPGHALSGYCVLPPAQSTVCEIPYFTRRLRGRR